MRTGRRIREVDLERPAIPRWAPALPEKPTRAPEPMRVPSPERVPAKEPVREA
jgi:hypothetical protein